MGYMSNLNWLAGFLPSTVSRFVVGIATSLRKLQHGLLDRPKNSLPRTWRFFRQKLKILWQHMQGPGGGRWVKDDI